MNISYIKGMRTGIYVGCVLMLLSGIGTALVVHARGGHEGHEGGGHEGGDHESMARETGCGGRPCPVGFINHPTWAGNTGPCWDYWIRGNAEGRNRTMLWDDFQVQCLARLNGQRLPVQRVAVHVHPKPVVQTAPALPRSAPPPLPKQTVVPRPVVVATVAPQPRDPIGNLLMHLFR